jgi:hypothetical protein
VLKSKPLLGWEVKGGISGREGVVDTMELVFEIVFFTLAIPAFIADVLAG